MRNYPKITIIIASSHHENRLIKTLKSIEQQQYTSLEVFIIQKIYHLKDKNFLQKYQKLNLYFSEIKFTHFGEAFNTVWDKITGKISHFIEAGQEYAPHALFKVATAFKNEHTNIVYGKNILIDIDKEQKVFLNKLYYQNIAKTIAWTRQTESQYFYRTDIIKKYKFQSNLKYWYHADIWYRYLLAYGLEGVLKMNDVLLYFYQKTQNVISVSKQIEQNTYFYNLAKEQGFELVIDFFEKNLLISDTLPLNLKLQCRSVGRQILNSFLLLRASQFYVQRDKKQTDNFLRQIDKSMLSKQDIKLWETIHFRNKYIPATLLNLFRKS